MLLGICICCRNILVCLGGTKVQVSQFFNTRLLVWHTKQKSKLHQSGTWTVKCNAIILLARRCRPPLLQVATIRHHLVTCYCFLHLNPGSANNYTELAYYSAITHLASAWFVAISRSATPGLPASNHHPLTHPRYFTLVAQQKFSNPASFFASFLYHDVNLRAPFSTRRCCYIF